MPITPTTFDGLVSAVKALAEDDSLEFATYIPAAIHLAEERLIKELDTEGVKTVASVVAVAGDQFLTKPSGFRFGHDLFYRCSSGVVFPQIKTNDFIKDYWPVNASASGYNNGQPKYYGNHDNTTWVLAPIPASAYTFTAVEVAQLSHLSSAVPTNYYTDFCSDVLLYATMSNMAEFMKDYATQVIWEGKYERALAGTNNQGRRSRRDDSTNPKNTKGVQNTLKGD
jgi:hypothetical protein